MAFLTFVFCLFIDATKLKSFAAMTRRGENVVNAMKSTMPWHEKFNGCGVYTYQDPKEYAAIAAIRKIAGKTIEKVVINWEKTTKLITRFQICRKSSSKSWRFYSECGQTDTSAKKEQAMDIVL